MVGKLIQLIRLVSLSILAITFQVALIECQDTPSHQSVSVSDPIKQLLAGDIDIRINVSPYKIHQGTMYVSSAATLNLTSEIRNEKYKNVPLQYKWSTNGETIATGVNVSSAAYKFTRTFDHNYLKVEVTHEDPQHHNETGSSQLNVTVKAPVVVNNPIGKLFLEHGELLDISLVINGSGPFSYCYRICREGGYIPCNFFLPCITFESTYSTRIPITKYLHYVGNYTLYFYVNNVINEETKHYAIKINETVREQSLPITPIACSILAVLILLSGITLHLQFRKTAYTETADFDFIGPGQEEDEWEEELSFIQRVKYIFCGSDQEDISERRHLLFANVDQR